MQHELQFADGVLARIHAAVGKQYDEHAYCLCSPGSNTCRRSSTCVATSAVQNSRGPVATSPSSDSDCWRDRCSNRWGVKQTADLGRDRLCAGVDRVAEHATGDREEDFAGVYEFAEAFDEDYPMRWVMSKS